MTHQTIERIIFDKLVTDNAYLRQTIPYLKAEYFHDRTDRVIFQIIEDYVRKYNTSPTKETLHIDLSKVDGISADAFQSAQSLINDIETVEMDKQWVLDQTEKFCKRQALHNALAKSVSILGEDGNFDSIPHILTDALMISFDTHVGHDFIEDADSRFNFYHTKEQRIPFGLEYFNRITGGGLPRKSLNIALAGTGVGKSLFMCDFASYCLTNGYNVLYITLEMAEERIAERIDANLLDITLDELKLIPKDTYDKKMARLKQKVRGKLIIKEYPTACAGSANFRHLIDELKLKKQFKADIIFIDYLNICVSSRLKNGANVNSYTYIKAIAEELRGLAVENNVPIVSATQTNREGFTSSDVGLENTAESFGLPATADFMFALIASEELDKLGQISVKQLKNRYNDIGIARRFVVGVDRSKMRLYDVEQSAQEGLMDGPERSPFDSSKFGTEDRERANPGLMFRKELFSGIR